MLVYLFNFIKKCKNPFLEEKNFGLKFEILAHSVICNPAKFKLSQNCVKFERKSC
jgi:hypothetical protein